MLKTLDLFSGIGGFSLGLEWTGGFETVAFCEIEDFPRRVLAKHWPNVPAYRDIMELSDDDLRRDGIAVDVITGGFPCQDISAARGKDAAGIKGEKSGLWSEYARLIGELRPQYVIVENSSMLLSRGIDFVLRDLAALGYDAVWHCIPASHIGAPHQRDRIWIVAYLRCEHIHGNKWATRFSQKMAENIEHAYRNRLQTSHSIREWEFSTWGAAWSGKTPSPFQGVDDGLPHWVDRTRATGNAIVPQIAELIGKSILQAEET